jgi:hypothetical protein
MERRRERKAEQAAVMRERWCELNPWLRNIPCILDLPSTRNAKRMSWEEIAALRKRAKEMG